MPDPMLYATVSDVQAAVDGVREVADDDEAAHSYEDSVHAVVLASIAAGVLSGGEAREAAKVALSTQDIEFARWCT